MEKNNQLLLQKALAGDEHAKEQFIDANKALIYSLVHRFAKGNQVEELFQVGCIGFMKAFNQFDLSYECNFSTYAVPVILGEIKRYFRDGLRRIRKRGDENARERVFDETRYRRRYHCGIARLALSDF